ncbi:MAG: ubiquinol-cytochrome C chaperone family protein [Acetobacteraceae bacterium]
MSGNTVEAVLAGFLGLIRRNKHERAGFELYGAAVAAARDPFLYTALGVPDTLDGRFDAIGLHAFLVIQRVKQEPEPGPALAQAVFDAMFSDMDINLRELGVSDLSVGKRVRAMWEAFHGRSHVYASALAQGDDAALAEALARNLWRGAPPPDGSAAALARLTHAQTACLAAQPFDALLAGRVRFLPAEEAAQ